jgi:hypothetical protein
VFWYKSLLETHVPKANLPSTKALPSAALDKGYTVKISSAKTSLPSIFFCQALGKGGKEKLP